MPQGSGPRVRAQSRKQTPLQPGRLRTGGLEAATGVRALKSHSQDTQSRPTEDTVKDKGGQESHTRVTEFRHPTSCKAAGQPKAFLYTNSLARGGAAQVEVGASHCDKGKVTVRTHRTVCDPHGDRVREGATSSSGQ